MGIKDQDQKLAQALEGRYHLFQDTKVELFSRLMIRRLRGCHHIDWLYSVGASGGILLMWDESC